MDFNEINKLKPGDKLITNSFTRNRSAGKGSIAIFNEISNHSMFSKENPGVIITWIKQTDKNGLVQKEVTQSNGDYFAEDFDLYEEVKLEYLKIC